jgi:hypothetical protein
MLARYSSKPKEFGDFFVGPDPVAVYTPPKFADEASELAFYYKNFCKRAGLNWKDINSFKHWAGQVHLKDKEELVASKLGFHREG